MNKKPQDLKKGSEAKVCNSCGQAINAVSPSGIFVDYLQIEKEWGYFSSKDMMGHSFNICETCYDKWIKTFKISVKEYDVTELFKNIV